MPPFVNRAHFPGKKSSVAIKKVFLGDHPEFGHESLAIYQDGK